MRSHSKGPANELAWHCTPGQRLSAAEATTASISAASDRGMRSRRSSYLELGDAESRPTSLSLVVVVVVVVVVIVVIAVVVIVVSDIVVVVN